MDRLRDRRVGDRGWVVDSLWVDATEVASGVADGCEAVGGSAGGVDCGGGSCGCVDWLAMA